MSAAFVRNVKSLIKMADGEGVLGGFLTPVAIFSPYIQVTKSVNLFKFVQLPTAS